MYEIRPKSRRFQLRLWHLFLLMLILAAVPLAVGLVELAIGYSRAGITDDLGKLPAIGSRLETLRVSGPVTYRFFWYPHGSTYNYSLSGLASHKSIAAWCKENGLILSQGKAFRGERATIESRLSKFVAISEQDRDTWEGPVLEDDYLIYYEGLDKQPHWFREACGVYRPSTSRFVIFLVVGR